MGSRIVFRQGSETRRLRAGPFALDYMGEPQFFRQPCFSNLGDPFRRMHATFPRSDDFPVAGNLIVRRMYGAPPVRPGTKIALAALQVAGELNIALRYDPRFLTDQDGRDFLTMLSERIKQTVISANK